MARKMIKAKRKTSRPDSSRMTEPDRRYFCITSGENPSTMTLVTPDLEYTIFGGGVNHTTVVGSRNYNRRVGNIISELGERALCGEGFHHGSYRIQFNHPDKI